MNKTADALESVATLIAGIEMMGGSITELVAEPGNVMFRVGNGLTGDDIRVVLDALGLDVVDAGENIGTRTGKDIEAMINFSIPDEYMGNCAPNGVCTMAALVARMTGAESIVAEEMRSDSVHFVVDARRFVAQRWSSCCVVNAEEYMQRLVRAGLRGFAKNVTIEFKPPRDRCNSCGEKNVDLQYGPDPYAKELWPGTPQAKRQICLCTGCYQERLDAI